MRIRKINSNISSLIGTKSKYGDIKDIKEFNTAKDAHDFVSKLTPYDINTYSYLTSDERESEKTKLLDKIDKCNGKVILVREEIDDEDSTYTTWRVMSEKM